MTGEKKGFISTTETLNLLSA